MLAIIIAPEGKVRSLTIPFDAIPMKDYKAAHLLGEHPWDVAAQILGIAVRTRKEPTAKSLSSAIEINVGAKNATMLGIETIYGASHYAISKASLCSCRVAIEDADTGAVVAEWWTFCHDITELPN